MAVAVSPLPDDIDALKALVSSMAVELSAAEARASAADALVVRLKQQIALLRCGSAWKRDPVSGVIGVEKCPLSPLA